MSNVGIALGAKRRIMAAGTRRIRWTRIGQALQRGVKGSRSRAANVQDSLLSCVYRPPQVGRATPTQRSDDETQALGPREAVRSRLAERPMGIRVWLHASAIAD
jgi:hypothetical protein